MWYQASCSLSLSLKAPLLWDFPGKKPGVSCHFLPQGTFPTQGWKSQLLYWSRILYLSATREDPIFLWKPKWLSCAQLFATPWTIQSGILQPSMLERVAFPFSRGSSQPRNWTRVSRLAGRFFTSWATSQVQEYWSGYPIPSPADLPNPGIKPGSPVLQADSLPTEISGKPCSLYKKWQMTSLSLTPGFGVLLHPGEGRWVLGGATLFQGQHSEVILRGNTHLYHLDPEKLLKPIGTRSQGYFGAYLPLSWLVDSEVNKYEQRMYHNLEGWDVESGEMILFPGRCLRWLGSCTGSEGHKRSQRPVSPDLSCPGLWTRVCDGWRGPLTCCHPQKDVRTLSPAGQSVSFFSHFCFSPLIKALEVIALWTNSLRPSAQVTISLETVIYKFWGERKGIWCTWAIVSNEEKSHTGRDPECYSSNLISSGGDL